MTLVGHDVRRCHGEAEARLAGTGLGAIAGMLLSAPWLATHDPAGIPLFVGGTPAFALIGALIGSVLAPGPATIDAPRLAAITPSASPSSVGLEVTLAF